MSLFGGSNSGYAEDKKDDTSHDQGDRSLLDHIPGMHHGNSNQHPISFPQGNMQQQHPSFNPPAGPPPYDPQPVNPAGDRISLGHSSTEAFPPEYVTGPAPFRDADNTSPVFVGSAIFPGGTVHPCKIAAKLNPPCRVPYGGMETEHRGRYDLLPFHPERMEWVNTANGEVPPGRRPVIGGYEMWGDHPSDLYHACGIIDGVQVPGKTGRHLNGANFAFGGQEHAFTNGRPYAILCWR